jgi:hypothetical protein
MARQLERSGIALNIVLTPTKQAWTKLYGEPGQFTPRLRSFVQRSLAGSGAELVESVFQPPDDAFYDAIHFRWSSTGSYTKALMNSVQS